MDDPEELLDLVDEHDQKIGVLRREEIVHMLDGASGFVRAANCFIVNDRAQVWIPRRTAHKKIAPSGLDFSAGEHVAAGETYEAAAIRGLKEELGIDSTPEDLEYVGKVSPESGIPYFESIFEYRCNEVPFYNHDDFISYEWLSPKELHTRLLAGEPSKKGLLPAVNLLIAHNKERREKN